jgi:3-phosphoshikimate 1-carboxyvinyltransferase
MRPLLNALTQLGVSAISTRGDGRAPVIIQGPLLPGKAIVEGEDSQPVSSLLIAGIFASGPIHLEVKNPGEKPWVSVTLNWLDRLGVTYKNDQFTSYSIQGRANYEGFDYVVPGDWSSAAFPIAAALVTQSELLVKNVDMTDCQGDKQLVSVFQKMGAHIEIDERKRTLYVKKGAKLQGIDVDINDFVDSITILAVAACFAEGETRIRNAAVAQHKECNRIRCISKELRKMGADIIEHDDGLTIRGSALKGADVLSYHDHRMAMSLAVAAMGASGETQIHDVDCVAKTFPTFVQDFNRMGAQINASFGQTA